MRPPPHFTPRPQNSRNVALEAYLIKPHSYVGLSCTAFQRREAGLLSPPAEQQLRFRCTTGRPNVSLSSFHIKVGAGGPLGSLGACPGCPGHGSKGAPVFPVPCPPQNSVALASIQLPPSLFSSLPAALAPPVVPPAVPQACILQLLVFRNGRLFRSHHGNASRPGGAGPGKRRGVATPVIFAGTSKGLAPLIPPPHIALILSLRVIRLPLPLPSA